MDPWKTRSASTSPISRTSVLSNPKFHPSCCADSCRNQSCCAGNRINKSVSWAVHNLRAESTAFSSLRPASGACYFVLAWNARTPLFPRGTSRAPWAREGEDRAVFAEGEPHRPWSLVISRRLFDIRRCRDLADWLGSRRTYGSAGSTTFSQRLRLMEHREGRCKCAHLRERKWHDDRNRKVVQSAKRLWLHTA